MSSDSLPQTSIVLGCGAVSVDFLATVASYPKPDDKIRSTGLKVQGGGNAGNALICVARLGLKPRVISKVADDTQGRGILDELKVDGVDTSFIVVSKDGTSPFTYIIVDNQTKTRTCIHTPGYPPMIPEDLSESSLLAALDGARIVYFDGRLHETALVVAHEAVRKDIPILIDAERPREGLDDLLKLADYVVCSAKFPQLWTEASTVPRALVSMLLRLPNIKFVIVTLGKDGCIMLERRDNEGPSSEEADVDSLVESLEMRTNESISIPTLLLKCTPFLTWEDTRLERSVGCQYQIDANQFTEAITEQLSSVTKLKAEGIGTVYGRLYVGTAEKIPPSELTDTTGAGDAFIGAVLFAICNNFSAEKMLSLAAVVAGAKCRALGARSGLPYHEDPRLASFLH
ncbi:ribokinase-like isoform X1 [Senna tora]|uniref:Ribokinase-like isoform X1 n=1 Tax=Senna tora TaxID=362788 RepID=A0A834SHH5_9FABA|nr:ribokinase-like isoform X1 [Senna tora]